MGNKTKREKYWTQAAQKAFEKRVHESLKDKVKMAIVHYTTGNPEWTPEDLERMIRFFKRHYGLGRYKEFTQLEGINSNGPTGDPSGTDGNNVAATG